MSRSLITAALSDWVSGVTDRQVVFESVHRMGPRPNRRSCSITFGVTPIGHHETTFEDIDPPPAIPDPDVIESSKTNQVLLLSMNLLGGRDTREDMGRLRGSMGLSRWHDLLWVAGLGFSRVSDFRDLSDIVLNEPESRHQADWEFIAREEITDDIPSIEKVTITNAGTGSSFTVEA